MQMKHDIEQGPIRPPSEATSLLIRRQGTARGINVPFVIPIVTQNLS